MEGARAPLFLQHSSNSRRLSRYWLGWMKFAKVVTIDFLHRACCRKVKWWTLGKCSWCIFISPPPPTGPSIPHKITQYHKVKTNFPFLSVIKINQKTDVEIKKVLKLYVRDWRQHFKWASNLRVACASHDATLLDIYWAKVMEYPCFSVWEIIVFPFLLCDLKI